MQSNALVPKEEVGDWDWIGDSGAAMPEMGNQDDCKLLQVLWDRPLVVRGCSGLNAARLCAVLSPVSGGAVIGIDAPGSLPFSLGFLQDVNAVG